VLDARDEITLAGAAQSHRQVKETKGPVVADELKIPRQPSYLLLQLVVAGR
jgi:hypothetical protein